MVPLLGIAVSKVELLLLLLLIRVVFECINGPTSVSRIKLEDRLQDDGDGNNEEDADVVAVVVVVVVVVNDGAVDDDAVAVVSCFTGAEAR